MAKKAEERARRKAEKLEKFDRVATLQKVVPELVPKAAIQPLHESEPKLAPHLAREAEKEPKAVFDGSRFEHPVTWCTSRVDHDGEWGWREPRRWTDDEWESVIHPHFKAFGEMTWAHVDSFASGSEHKMHHSQAFNRIVEEAQERWMHLDLGEFADSIFRFRLGGTRRAWGYIVQAHFHMVWWERRHKIHLKKK